VTDNTGLQSLPDIVTVTVDPGSRPIADAGTDITRFSDATVSLTAAASSDADTGQTLSYQWTQTAGPNVTLSNNTSESPAFTAPTIALGGPNEVLEFSLVVTDSSGFESLADTIVVTVTELVPIDCFASTSVGLVGNTDVCEGALIVNDAMLKSAGSAIVGGDGTFALTGPDSNVYTFENSEFNIFTGQVTDMTRLFHTTSFNGDITYWDTSKVVLFPGMFGFSPFNQNISGWDTSSATNMIGMFRDTSAFNQDISGWNTSNVTSMADMFTHSQAFNQDIGSWDTSNVTNMNFMFNSAQIFNQDLSQWCVSKIPVGHNKFSQLIIAAFLPVWGTCPAP
jgi:surface protein